MLIWLVHVGTSKLAEVLPGTRITPRSADPGTYPSTQSVPARIVKIRLGLGR